MKEALLIVNFGTSVPEAQKSMTAVETALAETLPEAEVYTAITSPMIRKILTGRGQKVFSLEQVLEELSGKDYDRVLVQPTHLLYGFEYDRIRACVQAYSGRFQELVLGQPLLAGTEDLCALARCMKARYGDRPEALVLMGHGTAHFANVVYPALQTALVLAGFPRAYVATVEGWPTIEEIMGQLAAAGETSVLLVPFMLVAGDHARNDMAGSGSESWKSRLEAEGFTVHCHMEGLGELLEVRELYCEHLKRLLPEVATV